MTWTTSSYSQNNGGCVTWWRKSSHSAVNNCVELCTCAVSNCGMIHVRDSKDPGGIILDYPQGSWDGGRAVHFMPVARSIVAAEHPQALAEAARRGHTPSLTWYQVSPGLDMGLSLWFDEQERDAWYRGVEDGEFSLEVPSADAPA